MKKLVLLFLSSCSLMACASVNLEDTRGYVLFSSFVRDFGDPVSSFELDTGESMHTFLKQCQSSSVIQKMEVIESKGRIHKVQVTNECPQIFDDYVLKHGTPTSHYTSPNGNTIYSFRKTCEYDPTKEGETLVVVGGDNLIQQISTPTKCPSYYESPAYEIDQRRKEMERERREHDSKIHEQINHLQGELSVVEAQFRAKSKSVEQRTAEWEDFYKKHSDLLEFEKKYGMETDPQTLAKQDFEKDQPELKGLESRAAQLGRQIDGLRSQLSSNK